MSSFDDSDLQRFRQEWKKELLKTNSTTYNSGSSSGSAVGDCGNSLSDLPCVSTDHGKYDNRKCHGRSGSNDYDEKKIQTAPDAQVQSGSQSGTSNSLISHNVCFQNFAASSEKGHALHDTRRVEDKNNEDSHSCGQFKDTFTSNADSSDISEYYPFKILTQFLNEAPKPQRFRSHSTKRKGSLTGESFMKRKYFCTELDDLNANKETKNDHPKDKLSVQKFEERILDAFIADLDEINEIPFFDSTLPREVAIKIFQHLDMKSLCNCSQVSSSWKSLANDELLWCRICHKLGYETHLRVGEGTKWKMKVCRHIEQKVLLESNWKARVGKPFHLNFARGGVLCAVLSRGSDIVAGYTSCNVRTWDANTGDICTYNASNTALVIDENAEELGLIPNEIEHLSSTKSITAASFRHGFIDVWSNSEGTDPIHTFTFRNPNISSLCTCDIDDTLSLVAASQNNHVQVSSIREQEGTCVSDMDTTTGVSKLHWFDSHHSNGEPSLLISCHSSVYLTRIDPHCPPKAGLTEHSLNELHNIIWAPICCIGCRGASDEVAVGFTLAGATTQAKVNIYDVSKNHLKASLTGHTWIISSMDMPSSLPNQMATGSGDRKIRSYDLRASSFPMSTLAGHIAKVTCVQMDDWKIVSGDEGGFVCVWDQRMARKLWDVHNRHPVQYCHFEDRLLIIGNVPYQKFPEQEFETVSSLRYRGTVQVYDFLANQLTQGIPDICLSSYNEPEAYDYNLGLAVPYDAV